MEQHKTIKATKQIQKMPQNMLLTAILSSNFYDVMQLKLVGRIVRFIYNN